MSDPAPASPPPPIDYAPTGRRRGWWKKYLIGGVLFALAIYATYNWRTIQRLYATTQTYMWQRRAMKHTLPKNTIVYSDDPTEIPRLLADPRYFQAMQNGPAVYEPDALREMIAWRDWEIGGITGMSSGNRRRTHGGLFLHERIPPGHPPVLVAIEAIPFGNSTWNQRVLSITGCVIHLGSPGQFFNWNGGITLPVLYVSLAQSDRFSLLAGQVDSSDSSHWTIPYKINGQVGTIDGWLHADETIDLRPRQGVITSHPAGAPAMIWRPVPTTVPTTNPVSHQPITRPSPG